MATRYRPIPEVQKTERSPGVNANRGKQLSRKKDKVNDVSVGLMEVDGAIMYYFNDVIKPRIDDSGGDNSTCLDCAGIPNGSAVEDVCGECDGPGAVYDCGCTDIPEGDCDCLGSVEDG